MTSHEYSSRLRAAADKLDNAPEFEVPDYEESYIAKSGIVRLSYYGDKDGFLAAVRAIGGGVKGGDEQSLEFKSGDIVLRVNRDLLCRIVKPAQPAEYDCEPLLSQLEEASLGSERSE